MLRKLPIRDTSKIAPRRFFCLSLISDFLPSLSPFRVFLLRSLFSPSLPLDQESAALGANFSDDGCIISFPFGRVGFLSSLFLLASSPRDCDSCLTWQLYWREKSLEGGKIPPLCSALLWPFVTHVIYTSLLALTGLPLSVLLTPLQRWRCRNQMRKSENESPPL